MNLGIYVIFGLLHQVLRYLSARAISLYKHEPTISNKCLSRYYYPKYVILSFDFGQIYIKFSQ